MEHAKTIMSQKSLRLLHDLIQSIGDEVSVANGQSLQRQCIWEEEARFKAVSDVMLHEAARLRTKVNGLASVNATLPNEILAYIFEFGALEDIEKRMHLPMFSRTVSHVCRLWRDVSLTSPALWTLFQPLLPPGVTSRAESLLDFVIQPRKTRAEYKPPGAPAFGQQLLRARSLRLTIGGNLYREDFQLMSSPAPHLTTLILRCHLGNNLSNLPGQLFAGHHPCLSEVAILRLAIPWSTFFPSNLRMLELVQISSEHQITMPKFMSVLRACPQLQVLHLDNSGPLMVSEQHQAAETVALLALRSFYWVNLSNLTATRVLLRGIVVPRTARVRVRAAVGDAFEGLMREGEKYSSDGAITLLQAVSSPRRTLTLARDGYLRHRLFDYDSGTADHISIFLPGYLSENMHILANCLASPIQSITLAQMYDIEANAVIRLFHALPEATMVFLHGSDCDERLIRALADLNWKHRIENISFSYSNIKPETILELARSRATSSAGPDNTGLTPLRRLSFKDCEYILDETLESLKALVPEVVQL